MAPSRFLSMSPATPLLLLRDIPGDVNGVKNTFSSWDNCMQKDYCKWPVIVAIIIASSIVFSILFCVVRCCCCGMECCCAACSCINACCPSPRGGRDRSTKYRDSAPPPHRGYQPTAAPIYPSVPQFATFDASKKVHADALPAMPSWDTATSKKVLNDDHPEELEMDKMDPHDETKPMLAHGASPQMGGTAYGQHGATPYSDHVGQIADPYAAQGYQGPNALAAGGLAAGAIGSRQQAGSAQGFRTPNGQRPGMAVSQDSYGGQRPGMAMSQDSYGSQAAGYQNPNAQRPGMPPSQNSYGVAAAGSYGQTRPQQRSYNNPTGAYGQQQTQNTGYGGPSYNDTGYAGGASQAYHQNSQSDIHPAQRQEYDSYNFAPAQSQSFGTAPAAPQPTYGGGQHEYTRSAGQVPSLLAPGSRGNNAYAGQQRQQSYQPYQNGQRQGQGQQTQWRDI